MYLHRNVKVVVEKVSPTNKGKDKRHPITTKLKTISFLPAMTPCSRVK